MVLIYFTKHSLHIHYFWSGTRRFASSLESWNTYLFFCLLMRAVKWTYMVVALLVSLFRTCWCSLCGSVISFNSYHTAWFISLHFQTTIVSSKINITFYNTVRCDMIWIFYAFWWISVFICIKIKKLIFNNEEVLNYFIFNIFKIHVTRVFISF